MASPRPWGLASVSQSSHGIFKFFAGYPQEGSVPASPVSGEVGSMYRAAARSAQSRSISSTSARRFTRMAFGGEARPAAHYCGCVLWLKKTDCNAGKLESDTSPSCDPQL